MSEVLLERDKTGKLVAVWVGSRRIERPDDCRSNSETWEILALKLLGALCGKSGVKS